MTRGDPLVGLEKGEPWLLLVVVSSHFYPLLVIQIIHSIETICSKHSRPPEYSESHSDYSTEYSFFIFMRIVYSFLCAFVWKLFLSTF